MDVVRIPAELLVHTATVTPPAGESSTGFIDGTSFDEPCFCESKRRMVRGPDGTTVLSDLTVYCAPGRASAIPVGSTVTSNGRTGTVLVSIDHDSAGLGAPDHTEVNCG